MADVDTSPTPALALPHACLLIAPKLFSKLFPLLPLTPMTALSLWSPFFLPNTQSCPTPRERAQLLAALAECQAYHSCLLMHVLLLLCHCEAFTHVDQLRKTPAIQSLPVSMLSVGLSVWELGRVGGRGRKDGGREEENAGGREGGGGGGELEEGRGGKGDGIGC